MEGREHGVGIKGRDRKGEGVVLRRQTTRVMPTRYEGLERRVEEGKTAGEDDMALVGDGERGGSDHLCGGGDVHGTGSRMLEEHGHPL